jgi:hypothetical protein
MKNRLSDLNNHLFAQLERLSDENLSQEQIANEAKRGEAMVAVADQIIRNADLSLKAVSLIATHGDRFASALPMISLPDSSVEGERVRPLRPLIKAAGT